jgi:methionyl-tRNA formyltransferase
MINVIFCGYRDWANDIFDSIAKHPKINLIKSIKSIEQYNIEQSSFDDNIDLILFIGWSWIIPKEITEKYLCLGIHPSDLPNYRGGSPIQHQIINGVKSSKITLMTLSSAKLDAGEIWMKEEFSLAGDNMNEIFENIKISSTKLLNDFLFIYPNIKPQEQILSEGSYYKRRTSLESRINIEDLKNKNLEDIYNFIRCLTDPYPNAYFEDKEGNRLLINGVKYIPNNK